MGRTSIKPTLQHLHNEGFEVHIIEGVAPAALCHERTMSRALVIGRLVSRDLVEEMATKVPVLLGELRSEGFPLASWSRIDTSDMARPALIEGSGRWDEVWD
jgi:hypothetical protein